MDLSYQRIRQKNRDTTLLLIPLVAILAKFIHLYMLPDKYYFDSWRLLTMLTGGKGMTNWGGYQSTVDFYKAINFFNWTTLTQWSIGLGIILTPIAMIIISRTKEMEMRECFFSLMIVGLLNIYVFSITKETIQICFFFLVYLIIQLPLKNTLLKVIGCALVFYWESTFYRSYYIIMAAMTIFMYLIFVWLRQREKIKRKHIVIIVVMCFVAVFAFFYASQFVAHDDYISALNSRDGTTETNEGASTSIENPIKVNGNLGIFMYDYVINAVRMMVPIELAFKGIFYLPFVVFQFFILYYYFKAIKNIKSLDDNMIVVVACYSAYFFGSVVFEPDFGSWVRHEAATFPILQLLAYKSNSYKNLEENLEEKPKKKRVVIYETEDV